MLRHQMRPPDVVRGSDDLMCLWSQLPGTAGSSTLPAPACRPLRRPWSIRRRQGCMHEGASACSQASCWCWSGLHAESWPVKEQPRSAAAGASCMLSCTSDLGCKSPHGASPCTPSCKHQQTGWLALLTLTYGGLCSNGSFRRQPSPLRVRPQQHNAVHRRPLCGRHRGRAPGVPFVLCCAVMCVCSSDQLLMTICLKGDASQRGWSALLNRGIYQNCDLENSMCKLPCPVLCQLWQRTMS